MIRNPAEATWQAFRSAARGAWRLRIPPEAFDWHHGSGVRQATLPFAAGSTTDPDRGAAELGTGRASHAGDGTVETASPCSPRVEDRPLWVPRKFLSKAQRVAHHSDPERWQLLYRLLWRLNTGTRHLLAVSIDEDVLRFERLDQEVRRDVHKARAFVRFRKIQLEDLRPQALARDPSGRSDQTRKPGQRGWAAQAGPERWNVAPDRPKLSPARSAELGEDEGLMAVWPGGSRDDSIYCAWHRSDHDVLPLTASFFVERFNDQRWMICTPQRSVRWDGAALEFAPGVERAPAGRDDLEELWSAYYSNIFNPARVNLRAMRAEMPQRYWASMPETALIPSLVQEAPRRLEEMLRRGNQPTSARSLTSGCTDLSDLRRKLPRCRACGLCEHATQAVFGEGEASAELLVIGEAPGDREDLAGRPFVGPAGVLLRNALTELGVEESQIYFTNVVKHFKFARAEEPHGKTRGGRIHKTPSQLEVSSCWPWLRAEMEAVAPQRILCLGATAARAVLGAEVRLTRDRGRIFEDRPWAPWILTTYHPARLLRAGSPLRAQLERVWRADLARAVLS